MISSGMKRGLAASAISALAITGVPALAFADSLPSQGTANTAVLQSVTAGNAVSVENDGTNSTVSLVASAGTGVDAIQFEYLPAGGTAPADLVAIGAPVTRTAEGDFQMEWSPNINIVNTAVTIYAQPVNGVGAPVGVADSEAGVTVSGSVDAVEIAKKAALGTFLQPYADGDATTVGDGDAHTATVSGVTGTTSADNFAGASVAIAAGVGTTGGTATVDPTSDTTAKTFTWSGVVNVAPTAVDETGAGAVNQILVRANNGEGGGPDTSEDAQAFNTYTQTIAGITAAPTNANVPAGQSGSVVVTVTDQNGQPVAGAHVAPVDEGTTGTPEGTTANAYTNGRGQVTFTGVSAGTHNYYVDASNQVGFTNGVDRSASATITSFTPRATTITFNSKDGNAFDIDEYNAGDTSVTVKDQNGNPLANEFFFYSFQYTPFSPSASDVAQTFTGQAQTNSQGVATIALPDSATATLGNNEGDGGTLVLSGYVNRDGTPPGQDAADLAIDPQTIKVGESDVFWDGPSTVARQAGSTQTFSGDVELADGTTLGGRRLTVDYAPGDENNDGAAGDGNSVLAPQTAQPAGTTRVNNTSAIVVTKADGTFSVAVSDPAVAAPGTQTVEYGAVLTATGTDTIPVTAPNTNDEGIGTDASGTVTINFVANANPGNISMGTTDIDSTAGENDGIEELIDNAATPGRPVTFRVLLTNASATPGPLAGQQVTLTTDHGFFTNTVTAAANINNSPGGLVADPAPSAGSLYGEWKDNGKTTTVTTDENGYAYVTLAIEKDAGFDDDGLVTSNITATSGTATNAQPIQVQWTSENALNPGSVELVPEGDQARVGDDVDLNVYTRDQFGNLSADNVVLSDDTADADINPTAVISQYENDDAVATADADGADGSVTQNITASWTQNSNTYRDSSDAAGFQAARLTASKTVTDEASISFYQAEISDATVTMTASPAGKVPVGTAVTETVTVLDQEGNPVPGVDVFFSQSGPGDATVTNTQRTTNAQGQVFYTFLGSEEGDAFISAVVDTGATPVTKTDTVTFGAKKKFIALQLRSDATGNKDVLKVNAKPIAEGLVAKVFVDGKKVAQHKLNSAGNHNFKITDKNGDKITTYVVKVAESATTHAAQNQEKVK